MILTWAQIIIGILLTVFGLLLLASPIVALIFLMPGVLSVSVGYGMRKGRSWTWVLGLWTGVVYIVLGLLGLLGPIVIIFGALTIYCLSRSDFREYLSKNPQKDNKSRQ